METPPPKAAHTASDGSGIGKAMVRQPYFCTLVVAIACLESAVANALQPSPLALEGQAQAEFAKVGTAVRKRLQREATGDLIGSHVAAQDAEAPCYRFLDIKRAISRLRSPSLASPSVEAARNPFLPDAFFLALLASPTRGAPMTVGRQEAVFRIGYPACDMYRPHEVPDRAGTEGAEQRPESRAIPAESSMEWPGDIYSSGVTKPAAGDRAAVATDLSAQHFLRRAAARADSGLPGTARRSRQPRVRRRRNSLKTGARDSSAVFGG